MDKVYRKDPMDRDLVTIFKGDDIEEFKTILNKNNIKFADYGTTFAKEWYQIFFYDPEGNIVEVHQFIDKK